MTTRRNDDPPDEPDPPKCPKCGECYTSTEDGENFTCDECGEKFKVPFEPNVGMENSDWPDLPDDFFMEESVFDKIEDESENSH